MQITDSHGMLLPRPHQEVRSYESMMRPQTLRELERPYPLDPPTPIRNTSLPEPVQYYGYENNPSWKYWNS